MADEYPTVKAAAVQATPVFLDRDKTVDKACDLITEAGANGADLIVFPEGFVPGHPSWFKFHAASGERSQRLSTNLFKNAVEVPSPATEQLAQAAASADSYVIIGVCERIPGTIGTMYNSQLYFSPAGTLAGKHQKLTPTLGEQMVHAPGGADTFGTFETEYGPMSGLICGENSNPLAVFALMAEHTRVHGMSWPPCFKDSAAMPQKIRIASQGFAYTSKAYVVSAAGVLSEPMIELLALTDEQAAAVDSPENSGGSLIVGPTGDIVAGPLGNDEEILYGDLDLEAGVVGKLTHDFAGHYNRPDIFQLHVNRTPSSLFTESRTAGERFATSHASRSTDQEAAGGGETETVTQQSDESIIDES